MVFQIITEEKSAETGKDRPQRHEVTKSFLGTRSFKIMGGIQISRVFVPLWREKSVFHLFSEVLN
jgi:hypothetical protein